jgi:hypothetical protein
VYWSRRTVNDLTVDHPYSEWLDDIAATLEIVVRLPPPRSVDESA